MSTTNEENTHSQYAMQLITASLVPMVLKAAIELGVLDIIHRDGPGALLSPSQIASQLPSHNNPDAPSVLDRMLRLLSAHSILTCSVSTHQTDHVEVLRLYGLAPVAKYFIRDQHGASLATLLNFCQDKVNKDSWYYKLYKACSFEFSFISVWQCFILSNLCPFRTYLRLESMIVACHKQVPFGRCSFGRRNSIYQCLWNGPGGVPCGRC